MTMHLQKESEAGRNGSNGRTGLEEAHIQDMPEATGAPNMAVAAVSRRVAELEQQMRDLEQLAPLFAALRDQADGLASTQQRVDVRLARAADDADRIQSQMDRLRDSVEIAISLKNDINRSEQLIPRTKDQLADLEDLTSRVAQKVESLETKSTAIDKVAARLDHVVREIAEVGAKQEDQAKAFAELKAHADGLKSLHAEVLQRFEEIRSHQVQIDAHDQATLEELAAIRKAAQKSGERVELAHREFDALNGRMLELNGNLDGLETRFELLEACRQVLDDTGTQIERLAEQVSSITKERSGLDELEQRLTQAQSLHIEVMDRSERIAVQQAEIDAKTEAAGEQLDKVQKEIRKTLHEAEELRAALDAASREKTELEGVREAITDGLEQARLVHAEMREMRQEQTETQQWLTDIQDAVDRVHDGIEELIGVQPRVEIVRREAERVSLAMSAIDSGREFLQEMHKQLHELQALGARLDPAPEGVSPPVEGLTGRPAWRFDTALSVDNSTWEFGIQFRLRGRTKRGIAVWLGPIRWFVGWARRHPAAASGAKQVEQLAAPPDANDEEAPDGE